MPDSTTKSTSTGSDAQRSLEEDYAEFLDLLVQATAMVQEDYFVLPVAGRKDRLYRERVYCYELYHCLRSVMDNSNYLFPYMLCGELDKSGHPYIRGNSLDRVKPDFLVHKPLSMTQNLVAIEVKPVARVQGVARTRKRVVAQGEIEKDLKTLTAFCRCGSYRHAIYLIYGDDYSRFQHIRSKAVALGRELGKRIDLDLIDLYLHSKPGESASCQPWR